jgi:hypothetical protein
LLVAVRRTAAASIAISSSLLAAVRSIPLSSNRSRMARIACGHPNAAGMSGFMSCDICARKSACALERTSVSLVALAAVSSGDSCCRSFRDICTK